MARPPTHAADGKRVQDVAVGVITARSHSAATTADILYTAESVSASGGKAAVVDAKNAARPLPGVAGVSRVPAAVGDPCFIARVGQAAVLYAFTERVETVECEEVA